jgi:hypothetical protein
VPAFCLGLIALRPGRYNANPSQRAVVRFASWSITDTLSFLLYHLISLLPGSLARPYRATPVSIAGYTNPNTHIIAPHVLRLVQSPAISPTNIHDNSTPSSSVFRFLIFRRHARLSRSISPWIQVETTHSSRLTKESCVQIAETKCRVVARAVSAIPVSIHQSLCSP